MKCFYHTDPDGHCAAFWVRWQTVSSVDEIIEHRSNMEFIPGQYGMQVPFDSIKPNEVVFIVDFSISVEDMDHLLQITDRVIWIDHHKTAMEKFADYPVEIEGIRRDGIAACLLTYYYFAKDNTNYIMQAQAEGIELYSDKYIRMVCSGAPNFLRLIGDYDAWLFELGDNSKYLHEAFRAYDTTPESSFWDGYALDLDSGQRNEEIARTNTLTARGQIMTQRRNAMMEEYVNSYGFQVMFEGHKTLAINIGNFSSDNIRDEYFQENDIVLAFVCRGKDWRVSLRSQKVDVSEIAKKFGGGGHKGASGFTTDDIWKYFVFSEED